MRSVTHAITTALRTAPTIFRQPRSRQESLEQLRKVLQAGAYTWQALTLREHERPHWYWRGLELLRKQALQS